MPTYYKKLYTRVETENRLKSFRGFADIDAPAEKVFALIEYVSNTGWWDRNITQIKMLKYEKSKSARYYLIYDLPWPVTDRDLCASATAITGTIPERNNMVRIIDYRQQGDANFAINSNLISPLAICGM